MRFQCCCLYRLIIYLSIYNISIYIIIYLYRYIVQHLQCQPCNDIPHWSNNFYFTSRTHAGSCAAPLPASLPDFFLFLGFIFCSCCPACLLCGFLPFAQVPAPGSFDDREKMRASPLPVVFSSVPFLLPYLSCSPSQVFLIKLTTTYVTERCWEHWY